MDDNPDFTCENALAFAKQKLEELSRGEKDVISLLQIELIFLVEDLSKVDKSKLTQADFYRTYLPRLRAIILRAEKIVRESSADMPIYRSNNVGQKRKDVKVDKGGEG